LAYEYSSSGCDILKYIDIHLVNTSLNPTMITTFYHAVYQIVTF